MLLDTNIWHAQKTCTLTGNTQIHPKSAFLTLWRQWQTFLITFVYKEERVSFSIFPHNLSTLRRTQKKSAFHSVNRYIHQKHSKRQSYLLLTNIPSFFSKKVRIVQGGTTSKESHSPLNLSLDSLIVSYSSHVWGIAEAIKIKKGMTACFIHAFSTFIR